MLADLSKDVLASLFENVEFFSYILIYYIFHILLYYILGKVSNKEY